MGRDDEQQEQVNGEIAHRRKNVLSMVQAVATQTLAASYQARGRPPTRLAAADSISFKSACVRAPASSILRINSSNRAARKCISRRSDPVSSPSVFTSMRRSSVSCALLTRPLTSVRRARCRRNVINRWAVRAVAEGSSQRPFSDAMPWRENAAKKNGGGYPPPSSFWPAIPSITGPPWK